MGLFKSIKKFLFGEKPKPPPIPAPVQAPAPVMQQAVQTPYVPPPPPPKSPAQLFYESILQRHMNGQSVFGDQYRNALLDKTNRELSLQSRESSDSVNQMLANMNLLGSSAQGNALGEIERARQREMANASNNLTLQEIDFLNRAGQGSVTADNSQQEQQRINNQVSQFATTNLQNNLKNVSDELFRNTNFNAGQQQQQYGNQFQSYKDANDNYQGNQATLANLATAGMAMFNPAAATGMTLSQALAARNAGKKAANSAEDANVYLAKTFGWGS